MISKLCGFRADRRGGAAVLFTLLVFVLVGSIGAAVDYSRASRTRAGFQNLADKAALAGAQVLSERPGSHEAAKALAQATLSGVTESPVANVRHDVSSAGAEVNVCITGTVESTLTAVLGIGGLDVSNCASASASRRRHLEIHLALDLSASMGMAADSAGRDRMQALWGCAFACHRPGSNVTPKMAHDAGIALRIDVLRDASRDFALAMLALDDPVDVRFAVHGIHDTAQRLLFPATGDAASIMHILDGVALRGRATRFDLALPIIDKDIGEQGSGLDPASPTKIILLVTDGVLSDESWDMPKDGTRPLDPQLCLGMKSRGVPVAVLYLRYLPIANHPRYQRTVARFIDDIPSEVRACASPSLYFEATEPNEISDAFASLTAKLTEGGLRLTR